MRHLGGGAWTGFDITTLAKQWKTGAKNGQCGFIMIGAEENTKKIGALSCEYGTGDYWPYVVVTYTSALSLNHSSVSVAQNGSIQLTASTQPAGLTVSWTSGNTAIASVSSSGLVMAKKPGTVNITASTTDADGITHQRTCTVYVHLADGVYRLRNQKSSKYLEAKAGGVIDGTVAVQQNLVTASANELQYYAQLWKVEYLGSGYYTIRPMHRLGSLLISDSNNNVILAGIETEETLESTPQEALWKIQYTTGGYVIQHGSDTSRALSPLGSMTATNVFMRTLSYNATNSAHHWSMTPVTGVADKLLMIDLENLTTVGSWDIYIAPEKAKTLQNLGIAVSFVSTGTNDQSFSLSASNTAININHYNGTVIGVTKEASSVLSIMYQRNGTLHTKRVNIGVSILADGTYYIRNWGRDGHVQCQTMADGAAVIHMGFDINAAQQWVFTQLGDNTYSIHSANSATRYYLGVSGDSSAEGQSIVLRTGTLTDGMKWRITTTASGAYKLTALTGVETDRVMKLDSELLNYPDEFGQSIIQSSYTLDEDYDGEPEDDLSGEYTFYYAYEDEWLLCPVSNGYVFEPQQTHVWCWLACARIASSRYIVSPISQASAALKCVGLGENSVVYPTYRQLQEISNEQLSGRIIGGTTSDLSLAISYIMGTPDVTGFDFRIYSEETLCAILDTLHPVIIGRIPYRDGKPSGIMHYTIIYGYRVVNEKCEFYIYDPLPMDTGTHRICSYEWICDGTQRRIDSDPEGEYGVWYGGAVFKVEGYDNFISWNDPALD